jgi:hypothetical protein
MIAGVRTSRADDESFHILNTVQHRRGDERVELVEAFEGQHGYAHGITSLCLIGRHYHFAIHEHRAAPAALADDADAGALVAAVELAAAVVVAAHARAAPGTAALIRIFKPLRCRARAESATVGPRAGLEAAAPELLA